MFGFDKSKRFQECNKLEQAYRLRHYILVPSVAFRFWTNSIIYKQPEYFENCWSLATGIAESDMKWYYTQEEVKQRLSSLSAVKASQGKQLAHDIVQDIGEALEKKHARVVSEG